MNIIDTSHIIESNNQLFFLRTYYKNGYNYFILYKINIYTIELKKINLGEQKFFGYIYYLCSYNNNIYLLINDKIVLINTSNYSVNLFNSSVPRSPIHFISKNNNILLEYFTKEFYILNLDDLSSKKYIRKLEDCDIAFYDEKFVIFDGEKFYKYDIETDKKEELRVCGFYPIKCIYHSMSYNNKVIYYSYDLNNIFILENDCIKRIDSAEKLFEKSLVVYNNKLIITGISGNIRKFIIKYLDLDLNIKY